MNDKNPEKVTLWQRIRRRGVMRVAISYLVIAWLVLQIGDVVLDPLGAPAWTMRLLIAVAAVGLPVALVLAWFLEFTPSGIEVDHLDEAATRPRVRGIRHYADVVIIGALLVVVAFLLLRQEGLIPEETAPTVVAILPFEELDSSEDNHFGDGFADTLIQKLGVIDELVVLASSSTFEFRDSGLDLTEAATGLGASVLLQGSLRRAGGLLRLDARLVDASSGQQLWVRNFRRPIEDVFRVQDEIANAVVSALGLQLSASQVERIANPPTRNLTAYDTFLRAGRDVLESRNAERFPEALRYLHDAIELDPDFALAHATLVEAMHLTASHRRWDTSWFDFADEARAAAARAQELDPGLGEGYLAEAFVAMWERDVGIAEHSQEHMIALTEKALELSPNNPRALKMLASLIDDPERELELFTRAAQIDPRSGIIHVNVAEQYFRSGDYDQAEQWLIRAARATDPYFTTGYKLLVEMTAWTAVRLDRAARWGRAFEAKYPEDWASKLSYLRSLIALGAWEEANQVLDRARQLADAGDDYIKFVYTHQGQWLAYAEGDTERAIRFAERYMREQLLTITSYPDLSGQAAPLMTVFELLALVDLERGDAPGALERYRQASLDAENLSWRNFDMRTVRPAVMYAILHRYTGEPEEADRLLRGMLAGMAEAPTRGIRGKGFTEFTIHAFLGETDAAIDALQSAVDEGWLLDWWGLDHGDFDANYKAVLEDPGFKRLYNEIDSRVAELRESFRANPDLPQELLLEAGLSNP